MNPDRDSSSKWGDGRLSEEVMSVRTSGFLDTALVTALGLWLTRARGVRAVNAPLLDVQIPL